MLTPDLTGPLVQFGAAGLIGWMWLSERRLAEQRERQLREAHDRLAHAAAGVTTLIDCIRDNTRVLAQLEAGQRTLSGLLAGMRMAAPRAAPRAEPRARSRQAARP